MLQGRCRLLLLLVSLPIVLGTRLLAAEAPERDPSNWERHLRANYRVEKIQLPQQLDGPFFVSGDLTPAKVRALQPQGDLNTGRSIAKAFIEDSASIFEIQDLSSELRETRATTGPHGRMHISYRRLVEGVPLEEVEFTIHIDSEGSIVAINGTLAPVTAELRGTIAEKVSAQLLGEADVREAIAGNLEDSSQDRNQIRFLRATLVATVVEPYVVWSVDVVVEPGVGRWKYLVDASTGEIITRKFDLQSSGSGISSMQDTPFRQSSDKKRGADLGTEISQRSQNGDLDPLRAKVVAADLVAMGRIIRQEPGTGLDTEYPVAFEVLEVYKGEFPTRDVLLLKESEQGRVNLGGLRDLPELLNGEQYVLFLRTDGNGGVFTLIGDALVNQHIDHRLRTPSGESLDSLRQRIYAAQGEGAVATRLVVQQVGGNQSVEPAEEVLGALPPNNPIDTIDRDQKPSAVEASAPQGPEALTTQTLLYEGFEGAFPGSWNVFDNDGSTNGEVYWDDTNYRSYSGGWSGGCADGGTNASPPGSDYSNNMQSWMVWGPFSLSDATGGAFSFRFWNASELNYDYFKYLVSTNGTNFYGYQVSGNSGGWLSRSIDFTNVPTLGDVTGDSSVWIAFLFTSDSSVTDEGAYVDEVRVEKTVSEPADLDLQLVDIASGTYAPGDPVTIHNVIQNIGGETSPGYRITFYASTNTTITSSDYQIGYVDRAGLAPSATHNFNTSGNLPASLPDGSYYIGALLSVSDANSSNNSNFDSNPITVNGVDPADLDLQLVDVTSGTYQPNDAITIHNVVQNIGSETSASYRITFYASTNTTITSSDVSVYRPSDGLRARARGQEAAGFLMGGA